MKNEPKKSSGIPVIIIILVLVGVVVGAWFLYQSSRGQGPKPATPTPGASPATPKPVATLNPNAPQGATPPNLLGSPTATVTVEEFADFQCGACAATHPAVKEVQGIYGSKIKFVFRNYPLPMHDKSYDAAVFAEAAGLQGKFWQMQDQLFTNQQSWSTAPNYRELWNGYAEKIGIDLQKLQSDIASAKARVDSDIARAKAIGVSSTPTIYINNESVPYPEANVAGLRRIIDAELQKPANASAPAAPAKK